MNTMNTWIYYPKFRSEQNIIHLLAEPNGKRVPAGWKMTLCNHLVNLKYVLPAPGEAIKCKTCQKREHHA